MLGLGDGYGGYKSKLKRVERRKLLALARFLTLLSKKETIGLVTKEMQPQSSTWIRHWVNIRNKFEEEEEEKSQKLQQEEEELQPQQHSEKRKIKGTSSLSFPEDLHNGSYEDDGGKHERETEEQAERERLKKQWLREQEQIKNEPLEIITVTGMGPATYELSKQGEVAV